MTRPMTQPLPKPHPLRVCVCVLPFGAKQASAASESCLLLGLCCRSIRGGGGMKSEREKLHARKLTFANTEAFTQTERDGKTERKGSGGGEKKNAGLAENSKYCRKRCLDCWIEGVGGRRGGRMITVVRNPTQWAQTCNQLPSEGRARWLASRSRVYYFLFVYLTIFWKLLMLRNIEWETAGWMMKWNGCGRVFQEKCGKD